MCCSRYAVALDTLYATTTRHCCRSTQLCSTTIEALSSHHPLRNLLPFHSLYTHSIAPIPHHLILYADADSYVWKMWKKISNPSTRYTAFTYLILTRGQRRRRDVGSSSTAGKIYGRTIRTKFYVYICWFILFHRLRVYTSFGFYPEYCVSRWNAVGVSLISCMAVRWSFATQLMDCYITAYFALCFLLDYMTCHGLCTNVHFSRRRGYIQPEVAIDRCIVRFREKWELRCSYIYVVRALL